jgi:hypothetical protein
MAEFSIRIFEFALLVYRPQGLTVLSPSHGHGLSLIFSDGTKRPIGPVASIVLADKDGRPLPPKPTAVANPGEFVFRMEEAVDPDVRVAASMLNGSVPGELNARIVLSGGTVRELDCSFGSITWEFDNGLRRAVTDQVVFTHPIGDDETLHLIVNDIAIPIRAGDQLTLNNEDSFGAGSFLEIEEFKTMCEMVQRADAPPPVNLRGKTRLPKLGSLRLFESTEVAAGTDFVCAVGQIDHHD